MNKKKVLLSAVFSVSVVLGSSLLITGCGKSDSNPSSNSSTSPKIQSLSFEELTLPQNDAELKSIRVSSKLTVSYDDGSTKDYNLSYKTVLKSGQQAGSWKFGTLYDENLQPLTAEDGSEFISNNPDADSLLKGKYVVTHFEDRPGALYKTELDNDGNAVSTEPIDFKNIGGTIINCAGDKSPWGTHLGAEEDYSLNSRYADKNSPYYVDCDLDTDGKTFTGTAGGSKSEFCSYVAEMQKYLHDYTIDKNNGYNGTEFTPYNYGYIVEVNVKDDGSTESAKHYITGKYTPETAIVMPDKKTLYLTDDGTAKGLYKLVLDQPQNGFNDNWSGTLYIAKVDQLSDQNGGKFNLSWIKLGHASDNEVKQLIDKKLKISDIFAIGDTDNCDTANGYKLIFEDSELMCLKLRTGADRSSKFTSDDEVKKAAAFLETRKYGAYLGGTTEFRKEEGITYDPDKNVVYIAMSSIEESMEDNYKGVEPANDIRVPKNKCGGIYKMTLDNNYNGTALEGILVGNPLDESDPNANEWYCDPNGIANPDNISYIGYNKLLIGEDTGKHLVNMVWAYDTETGNLIRIGHVPIGAEVTGSFGRGQLENGKYVIFMNAQHPFDEAPENRAGDPVRDDLIQNVTDEDRKGVVGYIEGIPSDLFNK